MKVMTTSVFAPWFFILLLCHSAAAADSFVDGTGTAVAYGQDARRIVCLAPNCTEMLWFLGLGSRQVARTDYCNFPLEAAALPTIGGFADTSLEAIVARQPDLVVAYQGNSLELVAQLRELKIEVLAFKEAGSLAEIGAQMETLYLVAAAHSAALPEKLSNWSDELAQASPPPVKRLTVLYGYPGEMTYTCSRGSFLNDLIGLAGGANVVSIDEHWPAVSAEYIASAAPQVLLTATACSGPRCDLTSEHQRIEADLSAQSPWNRLPAVQDRRLIVVEADILLRPGPRSLEALHQVAAQLSVWSK